MNKAVFYVMGAIVFSFVAMLLLVGVLSACSLSLRVPPLTLMIGIRLGASTAVFTLVGLGLFGLRKWAALAFSVMTLYMAFWALKDTLHSVPWLWNGIGYWFAVLLITPTVFTVKFWEILVWRSKS